MVPIIHLLVPFLLLNQAKGSPIFPIEKQSDLSTAAAGGELKRDHGEVYTCPKVMDMYTSWKDNIQDYAKELKSTPVQPFIPPSPEDIESVKDHQKNCPCLTCHKIDLLAFVEKNGFSVKARPRLESKNNWRISNAPPVDGHASASKRADPPPIKPEHFTGNYYNCPCWFCLDAEGQKRAEGYELEYEFMTLEAQAIFCPPDMRPAVLNVVYILSPEPPDDDGIEQATAIKQREVLYTNPNYYIRFEDHIFPEGPMLDYWGRCPCIRNLQRNGYDQWAPMGILPLYPYNTAQTFPNSIHSIKHNWIWVRNSE